MTLCYNSTAPLVAKARAVKSQRGRRHIKSVDVNGTAKRVGILILSKGVNVLTEPRDYKTCEYYKYSPLWQPCYQCWKNTVHHGCYVFKGEIKVLRIENDEPSTDTVNHPEHYTQGGIECIDAIKASMSKDEYLGYLKGNCIKYLWRYRQKGGIESLKKCEWYQKRLMEEVGE